MLKKLAPLHHFFLGTPMALNQLQQEALDTVLQGHNIFLTGAGGVGKSFLIHRITQELTARGKRVAVTALTGCAALLLGDKAKTIHSWAGIGLGKDSATVLASNIKRYNPRARRRWMMTHTLIIDEVSMLTPELLDKLSAVASSVRAIGGPFGGLQVILVGDFHQLPPVYKREDSDAPPEKEFAFEAQTWSDLNLHSVQLTEIVRQADPYFQKILMEARSGKLTDASFRVLQQRLGADWKSLKIKPTLLFSRRAEVEMINESNLKALTGPTFTYDVQTIFDATAEKGLTTASQEVQRAAQKLDRDAPYKPHLELKVGAQVMLIYNLDQEAGLVNGSRGVIEGFTATTPALPLVTFKNSSAPIPIGHQSWASDELDGVKRQQIPLVLAYALTIHRAQGATLDSALIDIGRSTFERGQAYVALSRVKSLDSLYLYDLDPLAFKTHPKVLSFYEAL